MEDEGHHHQVHGEEEPDVNHLEVWSCWQSLQQLSLIKIPCIPPDHLNAGGDGGDDQHEGEADHHPVLGERAQNNVEFT